VWLQERLIIACLLRTRLCVLASRSSSLYSTLYHIDRLLLTMNVIISVVSYEDNDDDDDDDD
jgi:hypothetical protein